MSTKKRFKLSFAQTLVMASNGESQRALIIAAQPIEGVPGWFNAIIAVEDGTMQTKAINRVDFDLAMRHMLALVEAEDEKAAPVLYGPNGEIRST